MSFLSRIFNKISPEQGKIEARRKPVYSNEERMDWAIEKARLTLWYFEEQMKSPGAEDKFFSIKVRIKEGELSEFVWLSTPDFDEEGNLYGAVCDDPVLVTNIKFGQLIGVGRSEIFDWLIVENDVLNGGYTLRSVRDGLSPEGRQEFDEALGIVIDAGEDHFVADFNTPEGAITSLEHAYQEKNIEKVLNCMDFQLKAEGILMDCNPGVIDESAIQEMAETLEQAYIELMRLDGMPDFTGVKCAFSRTQQVDENIWMLTECITFPDGNTSEQLIITVKTSNGWKVAGLVGDDTAS
ncbi:DUF2314 domain-containing protein [Pedobacter gandavensis]|uniref:DUF2314 domain-containing protein n=1 Tax=Pedobacter gandavensis TaxID=2679963 RepID=UPI0029304532|nr:DUF2314 domain-containing protein [Pedobacter gandavensis]